MARWARSVEDFPAGLLPPAPGWLAGCLAWLEANPGRRLPFGPFGDATDCYRLACEEAYGEPGLD